MIILRGTCSAHGERYLIEQEVNPEIGSGTYKLCLRCAKDAGAKLKPAALRQLADMEAEATPLGWRVFVDESGMVALDNKPLVELARRDGVQHPEFQHIVVPGEVIVAAFRAYAKDHVVGSPD